MITPGIRARTKFWRSRTAGQGGDMTWCNRPVIVGPQIPVECLPAKFQQDDATWFAIIFLDGELPKTDAVMGRPHVPIWPWPSMGLVPA